MTSDSASPRNRRNREVGARRAALPGVGEIGTGTPVRGIKKQTQRAAFTLIELLIVVAILAVLSALLFPVFARARSAAQRSTCQSNLKQLSAAFDLYLTDWDGTYPNSWQDRRSAFGEITNSWWDVQVADYVKNDGVFRCPTNDTESFSVHQAFNAQGVKTRQVNYALNNQLLRCPPGAFRFSYDGEPLDPATQTDVESPAETILLAEKMLDEAHHVPNAPNERGNQSQEIDVWFHLTAPGLDPADWNPTWGVARALHDKGSNFLFTDGHVKYLRLQDTFAAAPPSKTGGDAGLVPPGTSSTTDTGTPSGTTGGGSTTGAAPESPDFGREAEQIDPKLWLLDK